MDARRAMMIQSFGRGMVDNNKQDEAISTAHPSGSENEGAN